MSSEDFIESFYNLSALRSVTVNKTVIKVNMVLVGDDNTGKRSFMHAAVRGRLPEYLGSSEPPPPFIVVDVLGQKVLLQLIFWNIHSGMKREPFYILNRQTPLGFIFINISQPSTFEMAKILVQEMKTFMPGSPLFLIGTFGDMRIERENECVSQSAIMELVNKEQLNGYFETSILVNPREIEEVFRHCVQIFADSDFGRRFIINSLRYTEPVVAEHLKKLQNKKLNEIRSPSPSTKKRELQVKETKIKESKIKDKKVKRQSDTSHKAKENEIPNISPQSRKKQIEENERQKDVEQETLDTPRLRRTNARYCLAVQAEQYNNTEAELNCIPSLPPPPTLRLSTNSTTTSVPSTEIVFKSSEITATLGRKFDTPDRCSLIPVSSPRQVGPTFDSVTVSGFHDEFTEIPFDELQFDTEKRLVGRGTFSDVYKGQWRGRLVAIKKFKQIFKQPSAQATTDDRDIVTMFLTEIAILKKLRHPNIVMCYGGCTTPALCIVFEYMDGGSLGDVLFKQKRKLSEKEVISYAKDVAAAMDYLHSLEPKIVHRDLKADNILLNGSTAKITDFGLSCSKSMGTMVLNTPVGTGRYMAPELLTVGGYTEKIDVWAYGIILYEMATGIAPFLSLNYAALYHELVEKRSLPAIPAKCSHLLKDLIRKCLSFDPAKRPSFAEIYRTLQREGSPER